MDSWPIDDSWLEMDKEMSYELEDEAVRAQDWIWFDDDTMYGYNMCISSLDTHQYLASPLKLLLDHAVVDQTRNIYTLTNKIVFEGNVGRHTETPWSHAYSQFSHFAEWGYEQPPDEEYEHIHQIRTRGKNLDEFIAAGINFKYIIIVEEERVQ